MRVFLGVAAVAAVFAASACGSGRVPSAPSAAITADVNGSGSTNRSAATVSWQCFTQRGGAFGSNCPASGIARLLPSATGAALNAPSAPTGLTAVVNASVVALAWTAPASGDAPASYLIQAGSASGLTDLGSINIGSASVSIGVVGVPDGAYFVRVLAVNSAGTSAPSNEVLVVVGGGTPCAPLLAPSAVAASVSGSSVLVTWSAPTGCAPTDYLIQVGSTPGASNIASVRTGSNGTTFSATGVGAGTYFLRVSSVSGGTVSAPSNEVSFIVAGCSGPPGSPSGLTATVTGSTVAFVWNAPTGGCAATSYLLQAGSSFGAGDLASVPVNATTLTVAGVANGTYYVRVRGVNASGQGTPSNEAVVTVAPVVPQALVVGFQLFDPAAQPGPTTECRIRSQDEIPQPTTCRLQSTSFPLGANTIVSYAWTVQYTYLDIKTIQQTGSNPTLSFSDVCGRMTSTVDGVAQPLSVSLTITDNLGATATATSGSGSQPALQIRLFTCGS